MKVGIKLFEILLLLFMFNLIGLFRALNLENTPYKFGYGNFYRIIGPLGFLLGLIVSRENIVENSKKPWIIGVIFNISLIIVFFLLSR